MFRSLFFIILIFLFVRCNKRSDSETLSPTQIDSLYNQATNLFNNGKIEEALTVYKNFIPKAQQTNYDQGLSKAYVGLANCYYQLENPNEGIKYLTLAEKYAQNNPELLARINIIKGFILLNAQSYDEAEKKFKIVVEYANQIKDRKTAIMISDRAYVNIGNINFQLEKYDSALTNYYKAYASSDIVNSMGSSVNMAEIYLVNNKMDSAQKYIEIAENNIHFIPEKILQSLVNDGLRGVKGLYYIKKEDYKKAINELKDNPSTTTFYTTEELLGMAYAKQHKTDSALFYLEKNIENKLNSRLSNENTYSATALIYNDEKLALKEKYDQKRKVYLLLIGLTSFSCIALVYSIHNRRKFTKQRTQFLESEKERLQMEKELSDMKQEHYQKQVLAASIQLEQKNKFLDELKDNIKNNKDFNLNTYLKNEQLIDKDLNNIHDIVKEVHPNFFKNLNDITTSKLTNLDIKYAAYIYMNMDNTQIAAILNVDPKTVSVTKYRLKQKLGLTKDIDLDTFIRNLNV